LRQGKNPRDTCSCGADRRGSQGETLLHEVGHYFGLSEEELRGF
jgi:predicted Zn-dependent protease with MMP-like domain